MNTISQPSAIKLARERAGFSQQQVADHLQISVSHVCDLEMYDDELATTLSLAQIARLRTLLGLRLPQMFNKGNFGSSSPISLQELRERIVVHCAATGTTVEGLADKAGWEITAFVAAPESARADWDVDCLNDVCKAIGIQTEPCLEGIG